MFFKGVKIVNAKPRLKFGGGKIKQTTKMTKKQLNNDSIYLIGEEDQLMIPTKYANLVNDFLKKNNIKLSKKNNIDNPNYENVSIIGMVGEILIPHKYVKLVSDFLRSKNIKLPNM